jgi:hypothetical protein
MKVCNYKLDHCNGHRTCETLTSNIKLLALNESFSTERIVALRSIDNFSRRATISQQINTHLILPSVKHFSKDYFCKNEREYYFFLSITAGIFDT